MIALSAPELLSDNSPIKQAIKDGRLRSPADIRKAIDATDRLRQSSKALSNWLKEIQAKANESNEIVSIKNPTQIKRVLDKLEEVKNNLEIISPDLKNLPAARQIKKLKEDLNSLF